MDSFCYFCTNQIGHVKQKSAFEHAQKRADSDNPAHAQSIILVFALHAYIQ